MEVCLENSENEAEVVDIIIKEVNEVSSELPESADQTQESIDPSSDISNEPDKVREDSSTIISNFHLVKVENLLEKKFLCRSFEEQMEIKLLGPYKPKDIKISQSYRTDNRNFSIKWFDRVEWLTVNETNKKFYCFYCLLFNGDSVWSQEGFNNIKNLSEKTKIHDSSKMHIVNAFKFKCFGNSDSTLEVSVRETDVKCHNEMVDKNRHILGRLFDSVKFCVAHNVQPKLESNRKIFVSLAQEIAKFDPVLRESLQNSTPFDYTSHLVQEELLSSINSIYQEEVKGDIEKVEFVALLVEKLEQISSSVDQFALILRYLKNGLPTERFYCFVSCKTKNVEELAFNIRKELLPLNLVCKLIAQCYDGYISVRGPYGGIQDSLRKFFPHALFMHSHSHSYEKIIRQTCSYIPCIQKFFTDVFKFSEFFSPFTKEFETLNVEYMKNPNEVEDLQLNTESEIIKVLYLNEKELLRTFQKIRTEFGWSDKSVYEAIQLEAFLKDDQTFIFLLRLFFTIFKYVEVLTTTFKARTTCGEIMSALKCFETAIANLMDVIKKAPESQHKTASIDVCCIIITEIRERIEGSDHLLTFSVVNPYKYKLYARFPQDHVKVLECKYRMLVPVKLGNELRVLHKSESPFAVKNETSLLNVLLNTGLQETFSEVCKLIEIVLVTPISPVGSDKERVTDKLKEFVRNNWDDDQLLAYAELAIHSDIIDNIYNFKSRVIEHFAKNGIHQEDFLYQSYS